MATPLFIERRTWHSYPSPSKSGCPDAERRTLLRAPERRNPPKCVRPPRRCGRREPLFKDEILPVFEKHCVQRHGPSQQMGKLDLSHFGGPMKGGGSGPVIAPGNEESLVGVTPARILRELLA